jgi:dipeptidyl aminopeptidase/acylaminoacyl peptidase
VCIAVIALVFLISRRSDTPLPLSLPLQPTPIPTPLSVYTFEHLQTATFSAVSIRLGRVIQESDDSVAQMFYFTFPPNPSSPDTRTVSGLANIPKKAGEYPVIVMLRGYVPPGKFVSGTGTQPSAAVFVRNGYITLAPDFLGFGESDPKALDQFESRFQTYTTTLTLLQSLPRFKESLTASYSGQINADTTKIGLWGHSNGGHIALSTLAISGAAYPTVLWAPVSKSFPYSNLVYTDEDDDQGKEYRKDLAVFETAYDTDLFSPPRYFDWITASLQIHQGTNDIEVPYWWSDELVGILKEKAISVDYHKYPGADHNLRPAWNEVVDKSLEFYRLSL